MEGPLLPEARGATGAGIEGLRLAISSIGPGLLKPTPPMRARNYNIRELSCNEHIFGLALIAADQNKYLD